MTLFYNIIWIIIYWMTRIIYSGRLVNLCLLSKDLMNFEPPYRKCWLRPAVVFGGNKQERMFKKCIHFWRYLGFEVVHYYHCSLVFAQWLPCCLYKLDNNVVHILNHSLFCWPMLGWVGDVPIQWKVKMWVASVSFALINQLNGQKSSHKASTKHSSNLPFVTYAHQLYSSRPVSCIVQDADRTNFIPIGPN